MGLSTAKRVLLYSAIIAGAGLLACPTMTAAAVGAAGIAIAGNLAGNALATDIHSLVSGNKLTTLSNHHLQELVGRALSVCIECYERDVDPPVGIDKWLAFIRTPNTHTKALIAASKQHWDKLHLTGESSQLNDTEIHKAFTNRERTDPSPLVSAEEWDRHLADLAMYAEDKSRNPIWLNPDKRRSLAEYVAPRFALAVRELVKADLDPSVGTGGRVFVALHLDLMNALYASTRRIEAKTDDVLKKLETLQKHNAELSTLVVGALTKEQKANPDIFDLVEANRREHETTRKLIAEGFTEVNKKLDANTVSLARIEALLQSQKKSNPDTPPQLSPADQAILDAAKQHGSLKDRASASVLQPDQQTDELLRQLRARHEAEEFDLCMLEGKRWYFEKISRPDRAIPHFSRAMELRPADFDARNYAALSYAGARFGKPFDNCQNAIDIYTQTLRLVSPKSQDWAGTQNNLANALWAQAKAADGTGGDRARLLGEAVDAYRAALQVSTKADLPQQWAMTQNNLAIALSDQAKAADGPDRTRLLTEAVDAYRAALQVYTKADLPQDWATTQNNLANALSDQAYAADGTDRARLLAEAVDAYRAALQVYTKSALPQQWAATQNNLAIALRNQAKAADGPDRAHLLAEAVSAYRAALQVRTRADLPQDWATTQNNLANALADQANAADGTGGDRARLLAEAVDAYRAALQVRTKADLPQQWATTQNNLANALSDQAKAADGPDRARLLDEAVAAYRAALQVRNKANLPQQWAMTQNNLANTLSDQAKVADGPDRARLFREAISSLKGALTIYTYESFPQQHQEINESLQDLRESYESLPEAAAVPFDSIPPAK